MLTVLAVHKRYHWRLFLECLLRTIADCCGLTIPPRSDPTKRKDVLKNLAAKQLWYSGLRVVSGGTDTSPISGLVFGVVNREMKQKLRMWKKGSRNCFIFRFLNMVPCQCYRELIKDETEHNIAEDEFVCTPTNEEGDEEDIEEEEESVTVVNGEDEEPPQDVHGCSEGIWTTLRRGIVTLREAGSVPVFQAATEEDDVVFLKVVPPEGAPDPTKTAEELVDAIFERTQEYNDELMAAAEEDREEEEKEASKYENDDGDDEMRTYSVLKK